MGHLAVKSNFILNVHTVLGLIRKELIFVTAEHTVLCFACVTEAVLITKQYFIDD